MAEIFFRTRAVKGFKSAPKDDQKRIKLTIEVLKTGKFPVHTKKLEGINEGYRIRIGRWRILFVLNKFEIDVVDIFIKKGQEDYHHKV